MPVAHQGDISFHFQLRQKGTVSSDLFLDVDSCIPATGITAIFGHSGSGKTSLLRCIAGLEKTEKGYFSFNEDIWQDNNVFIPTHQRPIGYVFQEASLFPHLTAQKNLNYAIKRADSPVSSEFYRKVIEVMGVESILTHYPSQLSGGERQRIAIARALLIQPRLLLMDEPLAALDYQRKQEILPYLERIHESFGIPILYVSHSMDEVARLADHILVLEAGKVIAEGALTDVFSRIDLPKKLEDESGVILHGNISEKDHQWHLMRIEFANSHIWLPDTEEAIGQAVRIRILAKDVSLALSNHADSSIINRLPVTVDDIHSDQDKGMSQVRLSIDNVEKGQTGSDVIIAKLTQKSVHNLALSKGKSLWAQIKSVAIVR